jgi:ABC-type nitrate/sulfonate/bicarbonate transport system substrate-binding protein
MKKSSFLIPLFVCGLIYNVFAGGNKESKSGAQAYPKEINISYVESPFNLQCMVMKDRGMLEKAFAAKGVKVVWHNINSGADQTQAMAAGSLDIATVINSASVILANAAGNPVEIAALVSRPKKVFALMVGPKGPKTVADLKGKTIGGPKGTVLHEMLVAALVANNMKAEDVKFMQMGLPAARTALLSGQIDGALQAAALIIRDQEAGMRELFTADGYCVPTLLSAVRPAFAKQYPDLLKIFLDTQKAAYDWIKANTEAAIAIGCKYQDIKQADGEKLYQWNGMADNTFTDADLQAIKGDVKFLFEQKMIDKEVDPASFVLPLAYGK